MKLSVINKWRETWKTLARKRVNDDDSNKDELARVMGLFDLTALGLGTTLGLGVYVLAGSVARDEAGPAVCISFFIAAIASTFAGAPKNKSTLVWSILTPWSQLFSSFAKFEPTLLRTFETMICVVTIFDRMWTMI